MYVGNMGACNSIQQSGLCANTGVTKLQSAAQDNRWDTPTVSGAAIADYCSITRTASNTESDSLSQIRTEECVADEIQNKLQNLSELAEYSANDDCTDAERAGLQQEAEGIKEDIGRIACYSSRASFSAAPTNGAGAAEGIAAYADTGASGINKPDVNHEWADEETVVATWSAKIDPATISDGTTIALGEGDNKATFEFVFSDAEDAAAKPGNILVKVAIANKNNGEEIAKAFTATLADYVKDDTKAKALSEALGWKKNLNPDLEKKTEEEVPKEPVVCSWAKDDEAGVWNLTFTQSEAWAHDDDKLSVTIDSVRLSNIKFDGSKLTDINIAEVKTGDVITIGEYRFTLDFDSNGSDLVKWTDGDDSKTAVFNLKRENLLNRKDGSLHKALTVALQRVYPDKNLVIGVNENDSSNPPTFHIKIDVDSQPMTMNIVNSPELKDEDIDSNVADIKTPAYWEYEKVDFDEDKITDGESFKFKGIRFVFDTDGDTSDSKYVNSGQEKVVHVELKDSADPVETFVSTFNNWFKEDTRGGSKSGSGAARSGGIQAFKNIFRFVKAGAFEMRVDKNGTVATVAIYAKTKDALKDEKIELEEGEGWYNADGTLKEDTGAAEGTDGEGTSEEDEVSPASVEENAEQEAFEAKARALDAAGESNAAEIAAASLGLETVDISTQEGAKAAESTIASAAGKVTTLRSKLEDEESKMKAVSNDPLANADTISDVEQAKETVKNTAEQIVEEPEDSSQAHANLESGVIAELVAS